MTDRCANKCGSARFVLIAFLVGAIYLPSMTDGRPQFTNLRVFRSGELFSRDVWRPLLTSIGELAAASLDEASSRSGDFSSPIKRVSMATLLQQLQRQAQLNNQLNSDSEPTAKPAEFKSDDTPVQVYKESAVRRILRPSGSLVYSRNMADTNASGSIKVVVNPHLESSTTTTTESTTTTTTEAPTTTSESTTTASTTVAAPVKLAKFQTPLKIVQPNTISGGSGVKVSNGGKSLPNSPIYFIKLPSNAFVPTVRNPQDGSKPVFVATTWRPGGDVTTTTTTTTEGPSDLSTTTRKPPRTNSRIINIKGPFVFNGKPGGIYSAPAPYRPPNYLELLHQLYPKLKRAQFIRR